MDKEKSALVIKRFKKLTAITIFLILIGIGSEVILRGVSFGINSNTFYSIMNSGLVLAILVYYILSLLYLYKTIKILKLAGKIKVRPLLILLLTIFILPIIIFIIIRKKANAYLESN
jgi:hypothetical protein